MQLTEARGANSLAKLRVNKTMPLCSGIGKGSFPAPFSPVSEDTLMILAPVRSGQYGANRMESAREIQRNHIVQSDVSKLSNGTRRIVADVVHQNINGTAQSC